MEEKFDQLACLLTRVLRYVVSQLVDEICLDSSVFELEDLDDLRLIIIIERVCKQRLNKLILEGVAIEFSLPVPLSIICFKAEKYCTINIVRHGLHFSPHIQLDCSDTVDVSVV